MTTSTFPWHRHDYRVTFSRKRISMKERERWGLGNTPKNLPMADLIARPNVGLKDWLMMILMYMITQIWSLPDLMLDLGWCSYVRMMVTILTCLLDDDTDVLGYAKGRSARPNCGLEDWWESKQSVGHAKTTTPPPPKWPGSSSSFLVSKYLTCINLYNTCVTHRD